MSTRSKLGINKKRITAFLALLSFVSYMPVSCLPAFAVNIDAGTLPDLNNAINGSVDVNGNKMDVNVIGGKGLTLVKMQQLTGYSMQITKPL